MKEKIHDLLWAIGERYEDNADLHMNPMTVKQAAAHIAELFHERVAALREQYRVQAELAKQYREMSLEYESQLAAKDAALLIEHNLAEERGQKRDAALAQLAEMAEALELSEKELTLLYQIMDEGLPGVLGMPGHDLRQAGITARKKALSAAHITAEEGSDGPGEAD